jgi:ADP-dependent NAD(P)H-hydrate dehydratase / NAD(P)H-hydrate epimerase
MLRRAVFRHELLTGDEMARADRLAVERGVASLTLMENAGRAVAQAAADRVRVDETILVVCGPGNNGGDGFVAARVLRQRGFRVRLALLGLRDRLKGDAAEMAARWGEAIEPLTPATVEGADAIIDALFGAGLARPLEGMAGDVVAAINAARRLVVAVDVPSGLDGDTGGSGGPVVEAHVTVTFMRLKPGHLLLPGRRLCGEVRLADIGIPEDVLDSVKPRAFANCPSLWFAQFPRPRMDGHKYDRGHAVVVSGPAESTGAARLGARAALRAGAGLVTLVGSAAATAVNATHLTAVMLKALGDDSALADFLADRRRNAALLGPGAGVGAPTAASVLTLLAAPAAVVLDADALTSFADDAGEAVRAAGLGFVLRGAEVRPTADRLFAAIKARTAPVVLTPHQGEFKRLFGDAGGGGKLDRARAAAQASGAVVILKGADTVIAAPDGHAAINDNAPPWLATAGAGDVLAGIVLGLLAQRTPALLAACAGVWLHGECAKLVGPGLIAEDLPEALPRVLGPLLASPYAGG